MGLLGIKPFCVPHFSDYRKQPSFSLHDLPWVSTGIFQQLLIRERKWCKTREKHSRKTIVQLWGNVLFPHQKIHTTISLSHFTDTETPSRWEKLKLTCYAAQKHADSRITGTWRLMHLTHTYHTRDSSEECKPISALILITYLHIRPLPIPCGGWGVAGIVLEVLAYCVSSLPGKEISPFYFLLHNLLSVFLFNISV